MDLPFIYYCLFILRSRYRFLRQVIDENLRCSFVAGWAARMPENEVLLGGYYISAKVMLHKICYLSLCFVFCQLV